jgi:hypothetical protein
MIDSGLLFATTQKGSPHWGIVRLWGGDQTAPHFLQRFLGFRWNALAGWPKKSFILMLGIQDVIRPLQPSSQSSWQRAWEQEEPRQPRPPRPPPSPRPWRVLQQPSDPPPRRLQLQS